MGMLVRMEVNVPSVAQAIEGLGVGKTGKVQAFATARILHHMRRYMPWVTGQTANNLTQPAGTTAIVVAAPYARYLYMGSKMKDPNGMGPFPIKDSAGNVATFRYRKGAHPVATGVPLSYTHTVNPMAGDHWDRTMMQQEGAQIAQEIADFARGLRDG